MVCPHEHKKAFSTPSSAMMSLQCEMATSRGNHNRAKSTYTDDSIVEIAHTNKLVLLIMPLA